MLSVDSLTKTYGDMRAVDGLSFGVERGEIVALLGPNGAGKSTTFLCLCGLLRPDSGTISWNGKALGPERGRTVALIPETPEVYPLLTVWEHMVFVARSCRVSGDWQRRANELLDRLGLRDHRDSLGSALSKGLRQKTLIASTLLADAPVMMFDEPMIGLDPAGQRELRQLMFELRDAGTSLLVSTHMLDVASAVANRAVILKSGKAIFSGTLAELSAQASPEEDLETLFLRLTA